MSDVRRLMFDVTFSLHVVAPQSFSFIILSPNAKHLSWIASAMLLMILLYKGGEGHLIEP